MCLAFLVSYSSVYFARTGIFEREMVGLEELPAINHGIAYAILCTVALVLFSVRNHYSQNRGIWDELFLVLVTAFNMAMIEGFFQYSIKADFSRAWLFSNWALFFLFIMTLRWAIRRIGFARDLLRKPVCIIGNGALARDALEAIWADRYSGFVVERVVILSGAVDSSDHGLSAGKLQLERRAAALCVPYSVIHSISEMESLKSDCLYVVALEEIQPLVSGPLFDLLNRRRVEYGVIPPVRGVPIYGLEAHPFYATEIVILKWKNNLESLFSQSVKRTFDIVLSVILIMVLSPFLLILSILVYRQGGSPIFSQSRVGRYRKTFRCFKFRTMVANGDQVLTAHFAANPAAYVEWTSLQKLRDDPRVTPLGRWLRRTSLDELPQLFNVILGDMSLVGPRPIIREEMRRYGRDISTYLQVRPGITGLWQVSGRNNTSYEYRVALDIWYIRNWSMRSDIAILFRTLGTLLTMEGAY